MKLLLALLIATPAMAQTDYYDNRFNGRMTEVYSKQSKSNGYYYDSSKQTYYKPKSINRDVYSISPQGSLSWTYNTEQYKPKDLRISR